MRFSALISVLRSFGPVVVGVSLGFTLSLLSVSWTDKSCQLDGDESVNFGLDGLLKGARKPNSIPALNDIVSEEDIRPKIVPYIQVQQSTPKKFFR